MRWSLPFRWIVCSAFMLFTSNISAGEYSPPGLYDVEHYVLDNGLRVVLKPRDGAHTVAFRIVVGVGHLIPLPACHNLPIAQVADMFR